MIGLAKPLSLLLSTMLLAGCTSSQYSFLEDPKTGLSGAQSHVSAATGKQTVWIQSREEAESAAARTSQFLRSGKPLSADAAMQVALINNKGLQADLAEIGLSAADMWQETMFVNPKISLSFADTLSANVFETMIANNILALITRDKRVAVAEASFRQAQHRAANSALTLAFETRRAWIRAVAARETVTYLEKAQTAADASSDLAKELGRTGAFNKSTQAREHATYAEISAQLAEAKIAARAAREELNRAMGAWGGDITYTLPSALPRLPTNVMAKRNVESEALRKRVDLQVAKLGLEAVARQHKLTNATRYLTDLEIIALAEFEDEKGERGGFELAAKQGEIEFVLPIFDSGRARLRKAEFAYMQQANIVAEKAVNIRSEARGAYDRYRSSHELALHIRNRIVPLRKVISDEALLQYNGMIGSTFELLADTRANLNALLMSVNAKQNFWLAETDLRAAIHGGFSGGGERGGGMMALAGGGEGGH